MLRRHKLYIIEGSKIKRKSMFCPRCGAGIFMANHKGRYSCGKCGYTIMKKETEKK